MTIYGTGYRGLHYEPTSWFARIWPIAWLEFTAIFRTKRGVLLILASLWYIVPKLGVLYASLALGPENRFGRGALELIKQAGQVDPVAGQFWDPMQAGFYVDHATSLGFLVFLMLTALVSVRSVAADKGANALEIYWTRGISPFGYFVGKWLGSCVLLLSVFVAGPLWLWFMGLLMAPDWNYLATTIGFVPQALVFLCIHCVILSFVAVAFSTLTSSANLATFLWVGVLLGSVITGNVLHTLAREFWTGRSEVIWYKAVSIWDAMQRLVYGACDLSRHVPHPGDYSTWIAGLVVLIYVGVATGLILNQLRAEKALG